MTRSYSEHWKVAVEAPSQSIIPFSGIIGGSSHSELEDLAQAELLAHTEMIKCMKDFVSSSPSPASRRIYNVTDILKYVWWASLGANYLSSSKLVAVCRYLASLW